MTPAIETHQTRVLHAFLLSLSRIDHLGAINALKREVNLIAEKHTLVAIYREADNYIVVTSFFAFLLAWNDDGELYVINFEKV